MLARAEDLTKEGMLQGIQDSAAFLLFLSEGVLQRPYCQLEIRQALALNKPVVAPSFRSPASQQQGSTHQLNPLLPSSGG